MTPLVGEVAVMAGGMPCSRPGPVSTTSGPLATSSSAQWQVPTSLKVATGGGRLPGLRSEPSPDAPVCAASGPLSDAGRRSSRSEIAAALPRDGRLGRSVQVPSLGSVIAL